MSLPLVLWYFNPILGSHKWKSWKRWGDTFHAGKTYCQYYILYVNAWTSKLRTYSSCYLHIQNDPQVWGCNILFVVDWLYALIKILDKYRTGKRIRSKLSIWHHNYNSTYRYCIFILPYIVIDTYNINDHQCHRWYTLWWHIKTFWWANTCLCA